jgi:membrane-associated phospholipid phosphatase
MHFRKYRARAALAVAVAAVLLSRTAAAPASDGVETAGDVLQVALPVTALAATLSRDDTEGSLQFLKSFASTMGATYALKLTIDKERPDGGDMSFPSGHTSAAFSGASFLQRRYGWAYGLPAYAAASFVGWSRVDADRHHWEDVIAGAAIGIAGTYIFTRPWEEKVRMGIFYERGFAGFALNTRW